MPEQLLSIEDVARRLAVGRSFVYRAMQSIAGFPQPIRLSDSTPRFRESDIDAYIRTLAEGQPRATKAADFSTR